MKLKKTLFVALGVSMYAHAGLLTGGTAGLAFLAHYATGWRFGLLFFVINLPFVWFALRTMGWHFTVKTFVAGLDTLQHGGGKEHLEGRAIDVAFVRAVGEATPAGRKRQAKATTMARLIRAPIARR